MASWRKRRCTLPTAPSPTTTPMKRLISYIPRMQKGVKHLMACMVYWGARKGMGWIGIKRRSCRPESDTKREIRCKEKRACWRQEMMLKQDDHCLATPCGFITGLHNTCKHPPALAAWKPSDKESTSRHARDNAANIPCRYHTGLLRSFPHNTRHQTNTLLHRSINIINNW